MLKRLQQAHYLKYLSEQKGQVNYMRLKDLIGKKITVHQGSGKFRPALVRDVDTNRQLQVDYLDDGIVASGSADINRCFYNNKPLREIINKNISLTETLTYLKEELKDIPAIPKNTHYTDYIGLYHILQTGLEGKLGGYAIKANKTKENDMELSTTRNTHKLTPKEKMGLSSGAAGGVSINLFTDRILAGHRGTRKEAIAELPRQSEIYMKQDQDEFKEKYGFDMPDFITGPNHDLPDGFDNDFVMSWLLKNKKKYANNHVVYDIISYNRTAYEHYKELREREREERLILKKRIPVKPEFMEIALEHLPAKWTTDYDFCEKEAANFLKAISKHEDVFVQNENFRDFKNYLREFI